MLILRRRLNDSFWIGDVEVQVLEISGNRVKLGINAGKDVAITRSEVKLTEQENRIAAHSSQDLLSALVRQIKNSQTFSQKPENLAEKRSVARERNPEQVPGPAGSRT